MQSKKIYTINETKLAMAYFEGFDRKDSILCTTEEDGNHFVILNRFCSYEKGARWGRFHCKAMISSDSTLKIYAFSCDAAQEQAEEFNNFFQDGSVAWERKKACFVRDGKRFDNHEDILLYDMTGEYLWIAIEVESGLKKGISQLSDMRLDTQGDNFLWTFPEIYQEEGGFFHRYLSIFSSVYQDMSDQITNLDRLLDIGTTPMPFLMEIAQWLGFEPEGDFLDEGVMRSLVRELYSLNRIKGTKEVIGRLIRIVLGSETFYRYLIIERNKLEGYIPGNIRKTYQRLYGCGMQEVTVLVKHPMDEKLHSQLLYLIKQFKPARSHIRLVFCQKCWNLDSYCYLDFNAVFSKKEYAQMDEGSRMSGTIILA